MLRIVVIYIEFTFYGLGVHSKLDITCLLGSRNCIRLDRSDVFLYVSNMKGSSCFFLCQQDMLSGTILAWRRGLGHTLGSIDLSLSLAEPGHLYFHFLFSSAKELLLGLQMVHEFRVSLFFLCKQDMLSGTIAYVHKVFWRCC